MYRHLKLKAFILSRFKSPNSLMYVLEELNYFGVKIGLCRYELTCLEVTSAMRLKLS